MKRRVTTFIAAAIAVSMLGGCGGSAGGAGSTPDSTGVQGQEQKQTQPQEQADNQASDQSSLMNETGLPIVNEPMRFKIAGIKEAAWPDSLSDMQVIQKYERETNVIFDYQLYTSEAWNTQKTLIAASKDLPDAFGIGNPLNDQDIMDFSIQGVIIPLKALSQQYMPRFQKIISEYPAYYKSILTPDEEFYAFPTHYDIDFGNRGPVTHLNKEWIQALRPEYKIEQAETVEWIDESLTIDEFYELLLDFKNTYPDSIPLSYDNKELNSIYYAFDNLGLTSVENGKVVCGAVQDSWKDATIYANKLYSEGLLDQEVFTQNWDIFRAKVMEETPIVGAASMWSGLIAVPDFTDMDDPRYNNFIPMKPLIGPSGSQVWVKGADGVAIKGSFAITSACKNPEILARYQDYLYDEVLSLESSYGMLGQNLVDNGDNTYSQIYKDNAEMSFETSTLNTMFITTKEMNSRVQFAPATQMPQEVADFCVKPFQDASRTYPSFMMSEEDSREISTLRTDIEKYVDEKKAEFVVNGGVEDQWESFKAELEKIGLPRYLELLQKNYDRYQEMK